MNTKSLQPPNPILQSVREIRSVLAAAADNNDTGGKRKRVNPEDSPSSPVVAAAMFPRFSYMLPYHLEPAALKVIRQCNIKLAQLEVSLTKSLSSLSEPEAHTRRSASSILEALDQIEAPIHQVLQIGFVMSRFSDEWEDLKSWQLAYAKVQTLFLDQIEFKDSNIIYNALLTATTTKNRPSQTLLLSPRLVQSFQKRGSHIIVRPVLEDEDENDDAPTNK